MVCCLWGHRQRQRLSAVACGDTGNGKDFMLLPVGTQATASLFAVACVPTGNGIAFCCCPCPHRQRQ